MKRFLKTLALFLVPVALVCGVFFAALVRSGELVPTQRIVDATLDGSLSLYGLAYRDDTRAYKHAVASARGAQLLVLGTSRSMQLRGAFFGTDSFYNAGGGITYVSQALAFLEQMPASSLPDHLLLVLDQYFYNESWSSIEDGDSGEFPPYTTPDPYYAFRRMLPDYFDGKYSLLHVLGTGSGVYGFTAAARGAGFYADGSYSYGTAVLHPEDNADAGFSNTYSRIAGNTNRFEYGETPSARNLEATERLLAFCAENDILVTAFLPPYAPSVWLRMEETGRYGYITALLPALEPMFAAYGFEVFDYTCLPETQDAQYIDGFHGSDRVYAAICARLAEDSALLSPYLDADVLTALFEAPGSPLTVDLPA